MSIFASRSQTVVPLACDPPHTVTIRKLTGRELEAAQSAHLQTLIAGRQTRGWAAVFQRKLAEGTATDADASRVLADPLNGYDRYTVLKAGVSAWSYEEPVTPEAIEDLVDDAVEELATAIMRISKPSLFARDEDAAQKEADGAASVAR